MDDQEWERDRDRFAARFRGPDQDVPRTTSVRQVADERLRLWSPLARLVSDLGREVFAGNTVGEVLGRVIAIAVRVVPGAELANVTLRLSWGLGTASHTDPVTTSLDELQWRHQEGPFHDATRGDGTGMSGTPDLPQEPRWPAFGPAAAQYGVRSVLSAGAFPTGKAGLYGTVSVYAREPRGLAAANPDVVLLLASCAAVALGVANSDQGRTRPGWESQRRFNDVPVGLPLRSTFVIDRAAALLIDRRHLDPADAYEVLRRACEQLAELLRIPER